MSNMFEPDFGAHPSYY